MLTELVGAAAARAARKSRSPRPTARGWPCIGAARRGSRVFTSQQLLDLPGDTMVLRMDSWRAAPDLFPNVLTALVTAMSIALVSVLVLLGARHAPAPARRAGPGRRAGLPQGDGGLAHHRPARARPAGPHHLRQPGLLRDGGLQRRGTAGHATPRALLAARTGARIPEAPGRCAWPAGTRRRAKASSRSSCARTASRFPVLIFEAPLINAQGCRPAG